ncbi:MAG: TolC family protein [Anaerovoracaceae bacterium]|jgi:hypothetical protein|nr:TolC family protein [Anaerovoracaceae bacterium]
MKKILSISLAILLFISTGALAFGAVPSDVLGKDYEKAVSTLFEKEIVTGSTDGLFHPEDPLNRAQVCVMVVKAAGGSFEEGLSGFSDMVGYGWAEPFVLYAVQYGITSGYTDGTFKPSRSVSSNELVTFVLKAAGYSNDELTGVWPDNYISKGKELGLYKGLPEEMPLLATKWMAAQMLYNGLGLVEKAELQKVIEDPLDLDISLPTEGIISESMDFNGPPVRLSLKDAIKRMQTTGPGFEAAVITRDNIATAAKTNTEAWQAMREVDNIPKAKKDYIISEGGIIPPGTRSLNGKVVDLARVYLGKQAPIQYEIALNNLEATTVRAYFGMLQAAENYRIAKESLAIKTTLLSDVKRKYSLGVAARIDVATATNDVLSAQVAANQGLTGYNKARMAFNMQLNYPLMQEIVLTDTLKEGAMKPISMVDAIRSALNNRNDITIAKFELDRAQIEFASVSAYPRSSATYLEAKVAFDSKQMAYNNAFLSIEMEIRSKYMDLMDLKAEVASSKSTVENAKEGVRIAKLSYNAGMNTLTDVKTAEKNYNLAQLGLAKAITDYNLAIYDFNFSIGKGRGN